MSSSSSKDKKIIIIGIDGSQTTQHAFQWYIDHLHQRRHYVILVNCIELELVHPLADHKSNQTAGGQELVLSHCEKEKNHAKELSNFYTYKLKENKISGEYRMEGGKPGEKLVALGEEMKADAIVVGLRGTSAIKRTILGSVAHYVLYHAKCPVITVRKPSNGQGKATPPPHTPTHAGRTPPAGAPDAGMGSPCRRKMNPAK